MAPTPMGYPVPDCTYKTPATLPTYEMIYKDLDLHTRYGHHDLQVAQPAQQQGHGGGGGAPKPDRLPRPTIGEGASQSDWVYFKDSWARYKRSTCLDGQKAVDQLWACCSDELEGLSMTGGPTTAARSPPCSSPWRSWPYGRRTSWSML